MEGLESQRAALGFARRALSVTGREDGFRVDLVEGLFRPEEARHQEVKEAPQLERIILDRRAREQQPVPRPDHLDRLRRLRLAVLDHVPLTPCGRVSIAPHTP